MDTNANKDYIAENPFELTELQYAFECQRDKKPFQIVKKIKGKNGDNVTMTIKGNSITENYYEIWNDDYIVHFDLEQDNGKSGRGYARNRFNTIEELKAEIFSAFNLIEQAQMSLF